MDDLSSSNQTSKTKRNVILFVIAFIYSIGALGYCAYKSRPRITVSKEAPPIFHTSGGNKILFFQVSSESGPVWKLYPKGRRFSLDDLQTIKYGEVPSSWDQEFPKNSVPTPLIEGEKYQAFVVIYDSDVVRVNFTIKDGKVVELPRDR